ncbi:5,6-dimethylbenzimidazole synthase [Streptomyces sp. NPDC059003]|uniref:5,6-dimethylbenzimidazole synthase n=1 Tax=Streptomyces sp. NPDC059003 TaxID=3346691 RepID=UPI0036A833A3
MTPTDSTTDDPARPPTFGVTERHTVQDLLVWRRSVTRFAPDPVPEEILDTLLDLANLAPSVANSEPWRFVSVDTPHRREEVVDSFRRANSRALEGYSGERARTYARLRLTGIQEAPHHYAVFCDLGTRQGHGLGQQTMPETLQYSAAFAAYTFWLAARAHGVGVGWLSILEPEKVTAVLDVPRTWKIVAYLCVGRPTGHDDTGELARAGWQDRTGAGRQVLRR